MKAKAKAGEAPKRPVRVITVTSGKGGVGKSNLTLALALALAKLGKKVLIWDADLGLANIDVLLGLSTTATIHDLLNGHKSLSEIIADGPAGIRILPAASGILELGELAEGQKQRLLSEFDDWNDELDFLLIDTAAGIGSNVVYFNLAAQERIVVLTNEPTSITDAYALIKVLATRYQQHNFHILPNQVAGPKEAKNVFELLSTVADKHLGPVSLHLIGFVPKDEAVREAVRAQKPFLITDPESQASQKVMDIARRILANPPDEFAGGGLVFFLNRLASFGGTVD
ncbi:MAG: MinD/ParA family protein [Candidatus Adiutrix sp.]|jgi:flagellar biosynthesis protein FlhG|nr:MinD/ParA family protein [Candidatus Adiutrix sp.]